MERNEKKSLFTAVSEEESATVCGGISLTELVSSLIGPGGALVNSPTTPANTYLSSLGILSATAGGVTITVDLKGG